MLKHVVEHHSDEDEKDVKFKMKILRTHRSSFERQVYEGVRIQRERRKHEILNSKRCAIPRLEVKFEGKDKGKKSKEQLEEEKKELEMERRIRKKGEMSKKMRKIYIKKVVEVQGPQT